MRMAAINFSLLLIYTLLETVRGQSSIVSTNTITTGTKFSVTCDASKAATQQGVVSVQALLIYQNLTSSNSNVLIAQYNSKPPPGVNHNFTNILPGRNWTFTFTGGNEGVGNINSMKIVWDINDASCNDAGIYRCQIDYFQLTGASVTVLAPDQNVTALTGLSNFALSADPNYNEFAADDNVTFTCSIIGPATGVTFRWELWVTDQYGIDQPRSLPANSKIVNKPPTPQTGSTGCAQYNWVSTLGVQLPDYDQQDYRCIVSYLQQQQSSNWTIGLPNDQKPSIVSTNTVTTGGKFSVYCDSTRATTPGNSQFIQLMFVYRMLLVDRRNSLIAMYTSKHSAYFNTDVKNIPPGRSWDIRFSGDNNGSNNIATMKIVVDVNEATCSDAGIYRCQILYNLTNGYQTLVQAPDQNVTVSGTYNKAPPLSGSNWLRMALILTSYIIYQTMMNV